jgi:hypothetical protein
MVKNRWLFKLEISAAYREFNFRDCSGNLRYLLFCNINLKILYVTSSKKSLSYQPQFFRGSGNVNVLK